MKMRYFLWLFLVFLLLFRFVTTRPVYKEGDFVRITTRISGEPLRYAYGQLVSVAGLKALLPAYPQVGYGDRIVVDGEVGKGKLFSPELVEVKETLGFFPTLRKNLVDFYKQSLPEPHASLIAGITLGAKNMPQEFWDALTKTGTAHVVVASGTNVTMLSGFLFAAAALFAKRKRAIFVVLAGIVFYIVLSGFDAPIIRAGIMGGVVFAAQAAGRLISPWNALFYSAGAMLLVKPDWIIDLGFILSFAATACLLAFEVKIRSRLSFLPNFFKEGFSTSLAAQIGVSPILIVAFGSFNPLSPLINAFLLWTVPGIMVIGGIAGTIGLILPALGRLILYLAYPLTLWFVQIVSLFAR